MTEVTDRTDILEIYRTTGALRTGHFLLASGGHTDSFFQSATIMQFPNIAQELGRRIAERWKDTELDFVIGPALGGVVLSAVTAQFLGVRSLFAEKSNNSGEMFIRSGMMVREGEHFLVVEDIVTTGRSVMKATHAAEHAGGMCVGISSIIDRNGGATRFPFRYRYLAALHVPIFAPGACPLCKSGVSLEKI